jgi:hypothetical protein
VSASLPPGRMPLLRICGCEPLNGTLVATASAHCLCLCYGGTKYICPPPSSFLPTLLSELW